MALLCSVACMLGGCQGVGLAGFVVPAAPPHQALRPPASPISHPKSTQLGSAPGMGVLAAARLARPCRRAGVMGVCMGATGVGLDFYTELGVRKNADQKEIKRAFRKLSKQLHPDTCEGDPEMSKERFMRVVLAYETLSDPIRRAKYDVREGVIGAVNLIDDMFSANGEGWSENEMWGSATEMWGGSKSQVHVCSEFCDCRRGREPLDPPDGARKAKNKRWAKTRAPAPPPPRAATPEFDDVMSKGSEGDVDVDSSATFQELLNMQSKAAAKASLQTRPQSPPRLFKCSQCGMMTDDALTCIACGVSLSSPLDTQRKSVASVYTMHSAQGNSLGEDFMHELVHKNHISKPHTRRMQASSMMHLEDFFTGFDGFGGGFGVGGEKSEDDAVDSAVYSERLQEVQPAAKEVADSICEVCGCISGVEGRCDACGRGAHDEGESNLSKRWKKGRASEDVEQDVTLQELNKYLYKVRTRGAERTEEEWENVLNDEISRQADMRHVERTSKHQRGKHKYEKGDLKPWLGHARGIQPSSEQGGLKWREWGHVQDLVSGGAQVEYGMFGTEKKPEVFERVPVPSMDTAPAEEKDEVAADEEEGLGFLGANGREVLRKQGGITRESTKSSRAVVETQIEDLKFFISHLTAYSDRVRGEAERAEVLVRQLEVQSLAAEHAGCCRCSSCGCDSTNLERCECCGQQMTGGHGRSTNVVGVYTMHGRHATGLGDDERHNLVHKNHFSNSAGAPDVGLRSANVAWMVSGSFGIGNQKDATAGALPGQRIAKENCQACTEFEQILSKAKSTDMREQEYATYRALAAEAISLRRESERLDNVVARQLEKLTKLQGLLKEMLQKQDEVEQMLQDLGSWVKGGSANA